MRLRKPRIYVALAFYLVSGGVGTSGRICIGADGHIELEQGNTRCCPGDTETVPTDQENPCGTCLHIPLLTEHLQPKNMEVPGLSPMDNPGQPILLSSNHIAEMVSIVSSSREVSFSDPGESSISHLQSIILLC